MHTILTRYLYIGMFFFILFMACAVETPTDFNLFIGESYNWPTSSPAEQGMDWNILKGAFDEVKQKSYMYSLLVVRNGYLVAEGYYNGRDKNTMDMIFSATKSFVSALIGIAIQEGYIDSLDQKMMDFFPEYDTPDLDPRKREITIRHLLTMQSGFDQETNLSGVDTAPNMIAAIIASELRFDPGTDFLYSTHGSHILSGILTKATGMSTLAYAFQKLFTPLGIRSMYWSADQNGVTFGGSGLYLTPRDMARFGYLYLKEGFVDQQQIVPADWIVTSVQNYRSYREPWKEMDDVGYGFLWWTGRFGSYPVYFASGFGGQWILNVPDLDLIVVATMNAFMEVDWQNMESLIPIIHNYILPAVVD
jgi:CubicO group peptidase (beta-lactamase class C family)